jgi:YbbR domain-containing protein
MKNKRIPIVLSATIFAVLVWISISMREKYQVQLNAPLVLENLPRGRAVSNPIPRAVQLTFDDIGWKLTSVMWKSDLTWVLDLGSLSTSDRVLTLHDFSLPRGASLGLQPMAMKPESFLITFDTLVTKKVRVVADVALSFRAGYGQIGLPLISPESVVVAGAESLLRTIAVWPTAKRTFQQLRQSVDLTVSLADTLTQVLAFSPDQVHLRIDVQQLAEKTFEAIPVELASVPQNRQVLLSSPRVDVVLRGGLVQLAKVSRTDVRATVDYRVILADTSGLVEPAVAVPLGVQLVKRTPERLQYVVRKKN